MLLSFFVPVHEDLEQRRLAGAVLAHDADARPEITYTSYTKCVPYSLFKIYGLQTHNAMYMMSSSFVLLVSVVLYSLHGGVEVDVPEEVVLLPLVVKRHRAKHL